MNKLFIYPEGGLANRLYCIYSGIYWQKYFQVKMKILWEINHVCGIPFEKIFQPLPNVEVKTIYNMPLNDRMAFRSLKGRLYIRKLKRTHNYFSSIETGQIFSGGREEVMGEILRSPREYCIRYYGDFAGREHILDVIDDLKPTAEIENTVNEVMNPYMDFHTVGVHIRRTDFYKEYIQKSSLSAFIDCMEKVLKVKPDTYFYLATDDESIELELSEKFPLIKHKIFSDKKSRKTEAGMIDAYVDMLCLGRCKSVYGTYASTFSSMSAAIGGKECIPVSENMQILI